MGAITHMTPFEAVSIALSIIVALLIPLIVALIRGAMKWARVELKLDTAIARLTTIAEDSAAMRRELVEQMREDRKATDERLRWLERRRDPRQSGGASS